MQRRQFMKMLAAGGTVSALGACVPLGTPLGTLGAREVAQADFDVARFRIGGEPASRADWQAAVCARIGAGVGVHWPEIDEDIAVSTLMRNH